MIKKSLSILLAAMLVLVLFSSCSSVYDVPFFSKKEQSTTAVNTVVVTFPEGYTIIQIAKLLEEKGVCKADDFLTACKKPRNDIHIDNPDERVFLLEGYIFPDTYEFYLNCDAESVLEKFIENYKIKFNQDIKNKAEELNMTVDEVLTLASIIQKECDTSISECANVSSVFHNRLKSTSFPKLQSDVTTFYIKKSLGEYLGYQPNADIEDQNEDIRKYMQLYSTYYCNGLPAGPVCNPGMKAINAALNPSHTDYYYFVTDKETGEKFYFASTYSQHLKNCDIAGW